MREREKVHKVNFLSLTPKVNSGMASPLRRKYVYPKNLLNPLRAQHTHAAYVIVALDLSYTCVLSMASNSHWLKGYEVLKFAMSITVKNRQCHVFPLCTICTKMVSCQYFFFFFANPLIRTSLRFRYKKYSHNQFSDPKRKL